MANTSKKNQRDNANLQRAAVAERRASARRVREQRRQRLVITIAGAAIGVALLSLLVGVLYDQVYLPSRPVAQVSGETLTRNDYTAVRRRQIARDLDGTLELLARFGNQFGSQFAQRIPQLNADADPRSIRSAAVDNETVGNWIDQILIEKGAAGMGAQASDGEVAQALVSSLNQSFPPKASAPVTATASANATAPAAATTSAVSSTGNVSSPVQLAPSPTVLPTPKVEEAPAQEDAAIRRLYDAFTAQILNAKPNLSIDDFRNALREQYHRQVLTDKIEAQLVKEEGFQVSTDPSSIEVRHILIKVATPQGASAADQDAAFAKRKPEAEAVLRQIQGGADFATVAKQKSEDLTTKDKGGLLAPFDKTGKTQDGTQVDPAFLQAALTLAQPKQTYGQVVRTPFGWHVIQLESRVVPTKADQLREARSKAFDEWLKQRRAEANAQRFPPVTPTATEAPTAGGTAQALPTAPLGGVPTVVSDTTTLSNTNTLSTPVARTATAAPATTNVAATTAPAATSAATTQAAVPAATNPASSAATALPTTTP